METFLYCLYNDKDNSRRGIFVFCWRMTHFISLTFDIKKETKETPKKLHRSEMSEWDFPSQRAPSLLLRSKKIFLF